MENILLHDQIMLVDDSSIDNFVNKRVISRYNFAKDIIAFTRSTAALKHLISLSNSDVLPLPAILLLDLEMPEINGYEFLEAFELLSARVRNNISIVILTSSVNPADVERTSNYKSVITFFHKPLMKNNLDEINLLVRKKTLNFVMNTSLTRSMRL
ncbi:MAG TPA: response regulator [Bacteroidia bacterium]|jgi:CheY-like chemotaxis protein